MPEADSPSKEYRSNLAQELHELRSSGQSDLATHTLQAARETPIYKLSKLLWRHPDRLTKPPETGLDEGSPGAEFNHGTVSNEPSLYETFPFIKDLKGVGIGVGFDQMLDLVVNSDLEEVYMIDLLPKVSLSTRAALEIGKRHHELYGTYPAPSEFLAYFDPKQIALTLEMIGSAFSPEQKQVIAKALDGKVQFYRDKDSKIEPPRLVEHYLRFKAKQSEYRSWVSDAETLEKVISMYEAGKIKVIQADMTGAKSLPVIAETLRAANTPVSLIYISNAPYYIERYRNGAGFKQNLEELPVTDSTVVIETRFGDMPLPSSVRYDPAMYEIMLSWDYWVQTVEDLKANSDLGDELQFDGHHWRTGTDRERDSAISAYEDYLRRNGVSPKVGLYLSPRFVEMTTPSSIESEPPEHHQPTWKRSVARILAGLTLR